MEHVLDVIEDFSKSSGLRLNLEKSQGLRVNTNTGLFTKGIQIRWSNKINVLGLNFYNDRTENETGDIEDVHYIEKMSRICEYWKCR